MNLSTQGEGKREDKNVTVNVIQHDAKYNHNGDLCHYALSNVSRYISQ